MIGVMDVRLITSKYIIYFIGIQFSLSAGLWDDPPYQNDRYLGRTTCVAGVEISSIAACSSND